MNRFKLLLLTSSLLILPVKLEKTKTAVSNNFSKIEEVSSEISNYIESNKYICIGEKHYKYNDELIFAKVLEKLKEGKDYTIVLEIPYTEQQIVNDYLNGVTSNLKTTIELVDDVYLNLKNIKKSIEGGKKITVLCADKEYSESLSSYIPEVGTRDSFMYDKIMENEKKSSTIIIYIGRLHANKKKQEFSAYLKKELNIDGKGLGYLLFQKNEKTVSISFNNDGEGFDENYFFDKSFYE